MPTIFTKTPKLLLIFVFCFFIAGCGEKIISTSTDINEANKMMVALKENGIDTRRNTTGELGKEVYQVLVDDGFFSTGAELEAMRILEENCLPYKPPPPIAENSMGVSSMSAESEKRKRQAQIDLEQLFRGYKGVTCVSAILVYPEKSIDSLNPYKSSATIKISYKAQNPILSKETVQLQTARAVEKLEPGNVDVQLEYTPIAQAQLNTGDSWKKILITAGVAIGIIGVFMILILWMRRGKSNDDDDDDETELLEENELNLLESGEEE
jgi:type III secretory pathway lipoprotein EscJ